MAQKAGNKRKRSKDTGTPDEEAQLRGFIDQIGPGREPTGKIYRLPVDGRQVLLGTVTIYDFPVDEYGAYLRDAFGPGTFLIRTVRTNGTFGPSRIVRIGEWTRNQN